MSPIGWVLLGAGGFLVISVVLAVIVDEDGVKDLFGLVVGLLAAPAVALNVLARRTNVGFRVLDGESLVRFARMHVQGQPEVKAFTFFYGRRGVILVRKTVDLRKAERERAARGSR